MIGTELNDYIKHYLEKDKTHTAIMLTGEWGSGKTYYIENELIPYIYSYLYQKYSQSHIAI